jgi:type II secretory pathway component PulK
MEGIRSGARRTAMLTIVFLVFLAMFAIAGIFISIEAKHRRNRNSPDRN